MKLNTYLKYLSQNKLYTLVSIVGLAVSLMFVTVLGLYVKKEFSVDQFQKNKDCLYLFTTDGYSYGPMPLATYLQNSVPEVEDYCRMFSSGLSLNYNRDYFLSNAIYTDKSFFKLFSYFLIKGNAEDLFQEHGVVISKSFAAKVFQERDPMGEQLVIENNPMIVTGVFEDFPKETHLVNPDLILPIEIMAKHRNISNFEDNWDMGSVTTYLLLKPNVDIEKLSEKLEKDLIKTPYYKNQQLKSVKLIALKNIYFDIKDIRTTLRIQSNDYHKVTVMMGVAFLILLVSILNYINMTVAQSGFRGKEAAIRQLVGSSRKFIFIQFIEESLALVVFTFLLGIVLAFSVEEYFNQLLNTSLDLKHSFTLGVIGIIVLLILLVSFLSGVIPAYLVSTIKPIEIVKGTFRRKVKSIYSRILIGFQYTVAMILLMCSFFMIKQIKTWINADLGYKTEGIYEFFLSEPNLNYESLRSKLKQLSFVENVSFSFGAPWTGGNLIAREEGGVKQEFYYFKVDSVFFKVLEINEKPFGVPTEYAFSAWMTSETVNMLGLSEKKRHFKGMSGQEEYILNKLVPNMTIGDQKKKTRAMVFVPSKPNDTPWLTIVKTQEEMDPNEVIKQLESLVSNMLGGKKIKVSVLKDKVRKWYEAEINQTKLLNLFTLLTLLIMIMGVFAMSLYMLREKEKEIALRRVNGATEKEILCQLVFSTLKQLGFSFLIAVPVVYYAMTQWMNQFAHHITLSYWGFILCGSLIAFLALFTVFGLTLKAARTNPVVFLRNNN